MLEELSRWPVGRRAGGWCHTNGSLWQGSDLLCTVISLASLVSEWKPINQADMPLHWFCPEESAHKRWISFYRPAPQASPQWSGQNITISGRQEYESRYECSEVSACGERSWADWALWLHKACRGHVVLALKLFIRILVVNFCVFFCDLENKTEGMQFFMFPEN